MFGSTTSKPFGGFGTATTSQPSTSFGGFGQSSGGTLSFHIICNNVFSMFTHMRFSESNNRKIINLRFSYCPGFKGTDELSCFQECLELRRTSQHLALGQRQRLHQHSPSEDFPTPVEVLSSTTRPNLVGCSEPTPTLGLAPTLRGASEGSGLAQASGLVGA